MPHDRNSLKTLADETSAMADAARSAPLMTRLTLTDYRRVTMRLDDLQTLLAAELTGYDTQLSAEAPVPGAADLAGAAHQRADRALAGLGEVHNNLRYLLQAIKRRHPESGQLIANPGLQLVRLASNAVAIGEQVELFAPLKDATVRQHQQAVNELVTLASTLRLTLVRTSRFLTEVQLPAGLEITWPRDDVTDRAGQTVNLMGQAITYLKELQAVLTTATENRGE